MRFLVVDDSAVDRQFLTALLEDLGHQVEVSENPVGILDKIASGSYDAVFLDIVMPEQDGYKFLRELRINKNTNKQRVVFYSNKKTPIEVNYGLKRAGVDAYLTKPTTREELERVLQQL